MWTPAWMPHPVVHQRRRRPGGALPHGEPHQEHASPSAGWSVGGPCVSVGCRSQRNGRGPSGCRRRTSRSEAGLYPANPLTAQQSRPAGSAGRAGAMCRTPPSRILPGPAHTQGSLGCAFPHGMRRQRTVCQGLRGCCTSPAPSPVPHAHLRAQLKPREFLAFQPPDAAGCRPSVAAGLPGPRVCAGPQHEVEMFGWVLSPPRGAWHRGQDSGVLLQILGRAAGLS
mmetsp:Transcript_62551/g.111474  ORF Transcript_62551/g.111474 Transcript_62551/m.111474 type:complete len:226 (-) Transcript_62551:397-1074(-)